MLALNLFPKRTCRICKEELSEGLFYRTRAYADGIDAACIDCKRAPFGNIKCSVDGCDELVNCAGLCQLHYHRLRDKGELGGARKRFNTPRLCSVPGCTKKMRRLGYCDTHAQRFKKHGDPLVLMNAPRGTGTITPSGYRMVGHRSEHRLVMERQLARALTPDEHVHHTNGDRLDNRPENLELWSVSHPSGQRISEKIRWAKELLRKYEGVSLAEDTDVAVN